MVVILMEREMECAEGIAWPGTVLAVEAAIAACPDLLLNVTSLPLNPNEAPTGRRSHLGGSLSSNALTVGAADKSAASKGSSDTGAAVEDRSFS